MEGANNERMPKIVTMEGTREKGRSQKRWKVRLKII
jgi:hypothetical protein